MGVCRGVLEFDSAAKNERDAKRQDEMPRVSGQQRKQMSRICDAMRCGAGAGVSRLRGVSNRSEKENSMKNEESQRYPASEVGQEEDITRGGMGMHSQARGRDGKGPLCWRKGRINDDYYEEKR